MRATLITIGQPFMNVAAMLWRRRLAVFAAVLFTLVVVQVTSSSGAAGENQGLQPLAAPADVLAAGPLRVSSSQPALFCGRDGEGGLPDGVAHVGKLPGQRRGEPAGGV